MHVHAQRSDSSPADLGTTDEYRSLPSEVFVPAVPTGMEQARDSTRGGINAGYIGTFEMVTPVARERQITRDSPAEVETRDYVIDLELRVVVVAQKMAVFAVPGGSVPHGLTKSRSHPSLTRFDSDFLSAIRALLCKIDKMLPTRP